MREASALIIRGAGERAFSAGADTGELDVATPETALAYYERTGDVYEQLARLAVPSIAQIHGWCVGGGLEMALACDLRVADRERALLVPRGRARHPALERRHGARRARARPGRGAAPDPAGREDRRAQQALALGAHPRGRARRRGRRDRAGLGADAGLAAAPRRSRSRASRSTPPPTARTPRRWRPSASATRRSPDWSEPLARRRRGRRRHRRHRRGGLLRAPRPARHAVRGRRAGAGRLGPQPGARDRPAPARDGVDRPPHARAVPRPARAQRPGVRVRPRARTAA